MGDENEGAAAEAGADALDEQTFSLGVEGGRRLIEQEDAAAAEKAAGDSDTLSLAFAEAGAALAAERIEAVREVVDEVRHCCVQSVAQLLICGVGLADEEVFPDGAADESVALRDVHDVATCSRRGVYRFVTVVVFNLALVWKQEGKHKSDKCALADSGLAYYGCHTAWLEVVGEAVDDFFCTVRIGKVHIVEAEAELAVEPYRFAFFFLRKVEFTESVDGCERMYQGRDLLGYLGDRALDLSDELEEGCHRTEGDSL